MGQLIESESQVGEVHLRFLVSPCRFRIPDSVFLLHTKFDFVRGSSFPLRKVTPRLSWLYNSSISINIRHCYTYCTCMYMHKTVKLSSIILNIIGGFYQQCWHSILEQRLSIFCQCLPTVKLQSR